VKYNDQSYNDTKEFNLKLVVVIYREFIVKKIVYENSIKVYVF